MDDTIDAVTLLWGTVSQLKSRIFLDVETGIIRDDSDERLTEFERGSWCSQHVR
jgi:hypothetical protein